MKGSKGLLDKKRFKKIEKKILPAHRRTHCKRKLLMVRENSELYIIPNYRIIQGDCLQHLSDLRLFPVASIDLTFLDPPFNQNKKYNHHNDNLPDEEYWQIMDAVCKGVYNITSKGGAIYFMQREKNTERVLRCLRQAGWTFQNLIVWKKKTSAVPCSNKFGKHYQVIAFATKGETTRVFNRLRITPPLPANYKYEHENGVFVTDVWDDIRELTAGYFAGDEAIRNKNGERFHKQQSPVALLLRIILSSTKIGDTVLDPFAGTGTTLVVAEQLGRKSIGIEIDPENVRCIGNRIENISKADSTTRFYKDYIHTDNFKTIWHLDSVPSLPKKEEVLELFR